MTGDRTVKIKICGLKRPEDIGYVNEAVSYTHLDVYKRQILDNLFQDTAWDVSSDISVLQTLLAQEGLMDDGFIK